MRHPLALPGARCLPRGPCLLHHHRVSLPAHPRSRIRDSLSTSFLYLLKPHSLPNPPILKSPCSVLLLTRLPRYNNHRWRAHPTVRNRFIHLPPIHSTFLKIPIQPIDWYGQPEASQCLQARLIPCLAACHCSASP